MPMVGNARGDADFDAIAAENPNMDKLSPSETSKMKHLFEVLFSADTSYIQGNADVLPDAHGGTPLSNDAGQPSTGADPQGGTVSSVTTAPQEIIGKGKIQ